MSSGKKGKLSAPAAASTSSSSIKDNEKDEGVASPNEVALEQATDASTGLTGQDASKESFAFDILANIKSSQLQNGLRHGDYQRYRSYCSRRLRRLRVGLHFTHHKSNFKVKPIEPDMVTDVRYLALPLVDAERAWAYAMQLKNDMTQETQRKRFHLLKRLTKAASWAAKLETLCAARADAKTQLQAEAYSSWMSGCILFEREQHEKALAKFLRAKTVYEHLGSIGGSAMQILCEERVANLADSIRFCKYMLRNKGNAAAAGDDEDDVLGSSSSAGGDDLLAGKLEQLRKERMLEAAKSLDTIQWQGKTVPVSNDKVRLCLVEAKTLREQLDKAIVADSNKEVEVTATEGESANFSALYQRLFGAYDESLKVLREALLEPKMLEAHKAHLLALKEFATASRLEVQLMRNTQFISNVVAQLSAQEKNPAAWRAKKKIKPDEVVLLYEKTLQSVAELNEIANSNKNAQEKAIFSARTVHAQGCRAFYLAESYRRLRKFVESYLLYGRSIELIDDYQKQVSKLPASDSQALASLTQTAAELKKEGGLLRGNVHAQALLEEAEKLAKLAAGVAKVKVDDAAKSALTQQSKPLAARLDQWDGGDAGNHHALVEFPPQFQPAPAKPILFDLAFNAIQYPDLSSKLKKLEAAKKAAAAPPAAKPVAAATPAPTAAKKETVAAKPAPASASSSKPVEAKKEQPKPAAKKQPEPEPESESEEEEEEEEATPPPSKGKKQVEPEPEPEAEEYPSLAASSSKKAVKQPQAPPAKKVIAPPGEKESVKRERERLAREEEEKRLKAEEEAKKKKGWGLGGLAGGLVGKIWGSK